MPSQSFKDLLKVTDGRLGGGGQLDGLLQPGVKGLVGHFYALFEGLLAKVDTERHDSNVVLLNRFLWQISG